ncbi:MAG: sigma-70 family RNA polymerase sigma factor [Capnocytophaga sp.]|nr:sigma-70 family RNA polymerase sigma factor [Capnocytophaga sp.]
MPDLVQKKIQEAKKGNQKAFSYLLDVFWGDVYNFQLKRVDDENDAEDITIQTFSKAFDRIATYDENFSFKTWLIAISKNIHIDMIRNQQKNPLYTSSSEDNEVKTIVDESPTAEDNLITEQNLNRLLTCIKQLKEPYRTIIQLRYLNEKSYKEIAKLMDTSLSNVKVTLLRARKILADILKNN